MNKLDDTMRFLTFQEEGEKYPSKLSLWLTQAGKLFIQIGPEDDEAMMTQCIVLDKLDAQALADEITGILSVMDEPIPQKKPGRQLTIGN
jgi:hypothetical protein